MANPDLAFAQLFWDLMNRRTGELGHVDFLPQKPACDLKSPIEQPFPRSTPEEQGISSSYLAALVRELAANPHVNPHEFMVVRHGHAIYEGAFDPYKRGVWHVTYSMCKTFTGMAIGLLIDEGKLHLDDAVLDILKPTRGYLGTLLMQVKFSGLTIRHLLTMSSGVAFNEVGAISGNTWTESYFNARVKFDPGTKFEYNSMNSYILSAVVTELTGKTMFEYLSEKIFLPMGITKVFWETSPEGVTKAGWGMFLTQEDAAKLGCLYLNKGVWHGQRLLSREWVEEATKPQIETGRETNPSYGYQLWMNNLPGIYTYNGMLGQNVYVYPSLDLVVVINAGNDEVFAGGTMTKIIRKYFHKDYVPSDVPLPRDPVGELELATVRQKCEDPYGQARIQGGGWGRGKTAAAESDYFFHQIDGRLYEMRSKGIGLFPLIMQVVHNNFTNGIAALRFEMKSGIMNLVFREGEDVYTLPVGMGRSRHSVVRLNQEEYLVGTKGRYGYNEDGEPVLSLRIAFIEEATERRLKIVFHDRENITLQWDETPGNDIIQNILKMITTGSGNTNFIVDSVMNHINPELMEDAMQSAIEPVVNAVLVEKDM